MLARDRNGTAIYEGDYVRFPGSATEVEGVVYGMTRGSLNVAVPGYGAYGLWPSNAERVTKLKRRLTARG